MRTSVIRNDAGEVRLGWRLALAILLYVAAALLLRFTAISLKHRVWSIAIGLLFGVMGFLIVWLLATVVEKLSFTWKTVGLDWRSNSLPLILLGTLLALLLFLATILTDYVLGSHEPSLLSPGMAESPLDFVLNFVLYLAMGFGEEIVFRGYVQSRLLERYRAIWGIPITALLFVLLHQISYSLSPIVVVSGVMLWTTVGILYHVSKSLYLVGVFHGTMNTLLNSLHFDAGDISSLVVHTVTLCLTIGIALFKIRGSGSGKDRV